MLLPTGPTLPNLSHAPVDAVHCFEILVERLRDFHPVLSEDLSCFAESHRAEIQSSPTTTYRG
jgi:hypothetical protein